jgi:hypothetical protein
MPKFFPIIFVHGWGGPGDLVPFGDYSDRVAQTACAILVLAQGLRSQHIAP